MKYLIGNWKCYKGGSDAAAWLQTFLGGFAPIEGVHVAIAANFLLLPLLAPILQESGTSSISLAAQDVSSFPRGNYTGAVAADMLKPFVRYVIVGHSERRRYFHENPQEVVNKFTEVADAGLSPIICLENSERTILTDSIKDTECRGAILAYTPVEAVNFNIAESPERVAAEVARISELLPGLPVIYGGRVNTDNIGDYLALPGLSGVFVGSASLDVQKFLSLYKVFAG